MRDNDRQKVYTAEANWKQANEELSDSSLASFSFETVEDAQEIADLLSDHFGIKRVIVQLGRKSRDNYSTYYRYGHLNVSGPTMVLAPRWGLRATTVVHEFAHHLDAYGEDYTNDTGHGSSFRAAHIASVREMWGDELAESLRLCYEQKGLSTDITADQKKLEKAALKREELEGAEKIMYLVTDGDRFFERWTTPANRWSRDYLTNNGEPKLWARKGSAEKVAKELREGNVYEDWRSERWGAPDRDDWQVVEVTAYYYKGYASGCWRVNYRTLKKLRGL